MQTLNVQDVEDDFDDMLSKIHVKHVQIMEDGKRVAVMISTEEYRKCIKLFNECDSSSN